MQGSYIAPCHAEENIVSFSKLLSLSRSYGCSPTPKIPKPHGVFHPLAHNLSFSRKRRFTSISVNLSFLLPCPSTCFNVPPDPPRINKMETCSRVLNPRMANPYHCSLAQNKKKKKRLIILPCDREKNFRSIDPRPTSFPSNQLYTEASSSSLLFHHTHTHTHFFHLIFLKPINAASD